MFFYSPLPDFAKMLPKFKTGKKKQASSNCQASACHKHFLIILLTILFVINITFYIRATNKPDYKRGIQPLDIHQTAQNLNFSESVEPRRVLSGAGRFDNSRRYRIYDFVYVGERWSQVSQNLCLATHASADQLFRLVELAETWQGPISLAVFVPAESYHISVLYFQYLTRCFRSIRQNVSVHFVHPVDQPPTSTPGLILELSDCEDWESSFKKQPLRSWSYPQNHLRNVARKGCQTPYVFLLDIDIIPRAHLAQQLELFLENDTCKKCAFVVPVYEIFDDIMSLPKDKVALKKLVRRRKAQYYHKKVFDMNQGATKPSVWLKIPDSEKIKIAYPVKKFPFFYEPFYIARDEVPAHDERFVGYGFTRNTQTYEMHIAGYQFQVLNSAFALHRGLKSKRVKDVQRNEETLRNWKLLNGFKLEIYARYNYQPQKLTITATKEINSVHNNNITINNSISISHKKSK